MVYETYLKRYVICLKVSTYLLYNAFEKGINTMPFSGPITVLYLILKNQFLCIKCIGWHEILNPNDLV